MFPDDADDDDDGSLFKENDVEIYSVRFGIVTYTSAEFYDGSARIFYCSSSQVCTTFKFCNSLECSGVSRGSKAFREITPTP